jgi:hypothetical protein
LDENPNIKPSDTRLVLKIVIERLRTDERNRTPTYQGDLIADDIERIATASPAPSVIMVALPEVLLEGSTVANFCEP